MATSIAPGGSTPPKSLGVLVTVLLPEGTPNWVAEGSDEALLLQDESMKLGIIGSLEQFRNLFEAMRAAIVAHRVKRDLNGQHG